MWKGGRRKATELDGSDSFIELQVWQAGELDGWRRVFGRKKREERAPTPVARSAGNRAREVLPRCAGARAYAGVRLAQLPLTVHV